MKKYFKIVLTLTVLGILAGCSPGGSSGGAAANNENGLGSDTPPVAQYPLSVGRATSEAAVTAQ